MIIFQIFKTLTQQKQLIYLYNNLKEKFNQDFDNIFTNFVRNLIFSREIKPEEKLDIHDIVVDPNKLLVNYNTAATATSHTAEYAEKQYKNSEFLKNILINFLFNLNDVQLNQAVSLFKDLGVPHTHKGRRKKKRIYIY